MSVDTSIWYENLPDKWISKKLKYIVDLRNEKIVGGEIQNYIGLENIESKTGKFLPSINSEINIEGISNQFYKGDILFGKLRPYLAKCIEAEFDGVGTTELLALKGNTKLILSKYLKFMMLSPKFIDYINSSTYGTKMPRASWDFIGNIEVPLPSINHQQIIIDFITSKVSSVDKLLLQKKHLINLLEQQRQSIITEAVTKGLNPNVKMKDSGVEWIGEIPEHWEIKKVKHALNNLDYRRIPLSSEERGKMSEKTYDYYGASGVIDKVDNYLFDETLILIGEDGANLFSRSTPLAFLAKGKYWVNNHAHILKPKIGSIDYFVNLLESMDYSIYISGSAQPKLTQEALGNISILLPPIEEQFVIGNFVNNVLNEHNKVISMLNIQIEKLKEYRQTLISEAVTGKIDIRDMELD